MVLKWCGAQCFIQTRGFSAGAPDATRVGEKYNNFFFRDTYVFGAFNPLDGLQLHASLT